MQTLFGLELSTGTKWVIAFAVILALLALLGLFARQIKGGRLRMKGQGGGRARLPRLGVVDTHDLDRQRQLVLIRRDNVEHLIMIGGLSDVVVESNIIRGAQRATPTGGTEFVLPERPLMEPALTEPPQPVAPPAPVPPPQPETRRAPPPLVEMPDPPRRDTAPPSQQTVPPRPPAAAPDVGVAVASAAAAAGVAGALAGVSRTSQPASAPPPAAPSFAREPAPLPAAGATDPDDLARQLEAALMRPNSAIRPAQPPAETARAPEPRPMLEPPAPEPAPEPEPAPAAEIASVIELPPPEEPPAPMPSPPAPPVTAGQPTALPLDVAAELEMALGLRPERVAPVAADAPPMTPEPAFALPDPEPAPRAAAMEPHVEPEPEPDTGLFDEPGPEPVFQPEPIRAPEPPVHMPEPMPEPEPAPAAPEPEPKPAAIDPFSVDAIEAEFARLLGRDPKAKG